MAKSKDVKVKGEVTTISYKKGEKLPEFQPLDEGTYEFTLKNAGKPFPKGWKVKPGKFPNKKVVWEALDTADEKSGNNRTVNEYISLSPGALPIGPIRLAYAAQMDLELKAGPKSKPNHSTVRENAAAIDEMLQALKKEELTLRGDVTHEDFNGSKMARIRWLPPEDLDEESEEEVDEDEEETDEDEADESDDDESGDDDTDSDDEDDDADEDADEADEDDDEDEADDADEDSDDDDIDDDDVKEHKKPIKPGKKVKQGPAGKKGPAAKPGKKPKKK